MYLDVTSLPAFGCPVRVSVRFSSLFWPTITEFDSLPTSFGWWWIYLLHTARAGGKVALDNLTDDFQPVRAHSLRPCRPFTASIPHEPPTVILSSEFFSAHHHLPEPEGAYPLHARCRGVQVAYLKPAA